MTNIGRQTQTKNPMRHRLRRLFGRPTIRSREELFDHWTSPTPDGGDPTIMPAHEHRSRALVKLLTDVDRDVKVLEVGCNVGRNLAHLHAAGFHSLEGLEINPHAVARLRETYPQLEGCTIHVGAAEDRLPGIPDRAYGLVFTMAVIEHIHPDSAAVFDEMTRICDRRLLAIEPVANSSARQFPYDVPALFTARGFQLVSDQPMSSFPEVRGDMSFEQYHAWHFRRP